MFVYCSFDCSSCSSFIDLFTSRRGFGAGFLSVLEPGKLPNGPINDGRPAAGPVLPGAAAVSAQPARPGSVAKVWFHGDFTACKNVYVCRGTKKYNKCGFFF